MENNNSVIWRVGISVFIVFIIFFVSASENSGAVFAGEFKQMFSKSSLLQKGFVIPASCESGFDECGLGHQTSFVEPQPTCFCNSAPNSCGRTQPGLGPCGSPCPMLPPGDGKEYCSIPVSSFTSAGISSGGIGTGSTAVGTISEGGIVSGVDLTSGSSNILTLGESRIVNKGERCLISWHASPATSCTLVGPGINATGVSGVAVQTPRIGVDTMGSSVYKLTCYNGKVVTAETRFTCRMNPNFSETL